MKLFPWLVDVLKHSGSGRRRLRKLPSDVARSVNILESRVCPSTGTYYGAASADWFGHPELSPADSTESDSAETSVDNDFATGETEALQFLVRLTDEATASAGSPSGAQDFFAGSNADLRITAGLGLPGQVLVATSADPARAAAALEANDAVAHFEENFSVGGALFPDEQTNSTQFVRQYGLHNTGQSGGVSDADIDAPEAWDIATGSIETVVAVIDSGVDYTHPDLYLNIWINQGELPESFEASLNDVDSDGLITFRDLNHALNAVFVTDLNGTGYIDAGDLLDDARWADGIDTDGNGFEDDLVGWDFRDEDNRPFDEHRHGTHVAGIIGATGNNGRGVTGVAWQTSMMPLRFLDENKRGEISDAIEAINYTTMMRTRSAKPVNVRVSNNSWGTSGEFSQHLFDAVAGNLNADILFVAASGNGNVLGRGVDNDKNPFFPASLELDNVISVAAVNDRGELAAFSNFGSDSVDIAAPGVSIRSTIPDGRYVFRSGTSMATPHVAGVAALVLDQFPSATALEVRDAILSGAEIIDSLDGRVSGSRTLNAFKSLNASTFGPVPELFPVANITAAGASDLLVTVRYQDDDSVDATSFDIRDVEITREGFSETLLTPVEAITGPGVMTYRFTAPGGTWDATENGTWVVHLREGEIRDESNLYTAPRRLGDFRVEIDDPNVFFVNTTMDTPDDDPGDDRPADSEDRVSLRAAITQANDAAVPTTIVVPDGFYTLTIPGPNTDDSATGDLDLNSTQGITIIGGGANSTIIDGQQLDRVFDIASGSTAVLRGVTITNGSATTGGGIENSGILTIESTIVSSNTAHTAGGGVYSNHLLTIVNSSIENNQTLSRFFGQGGGGLAILGAANGDPPGQTTIHDTSIVNNTSAGAGGGLFAFDSELALTGVTISGNIALRENGGGGLLQATDEFKTSTLTSVTITQNDAPVGSGGGLATDTSAAQVMLSNSIIAENLARTSADVEGLIISDGSNLFGQPSATLAGWRTLGTGIADFDQIGTAQSPLDPQLQPLRRSGGIVQTQAPIAGGRSSNDELAGVAKLALTPGLPIVYSTVELEPNNSRGEAMRLDDRGWSLDSDPYIANSTTIPHVTITGTGDGTFDYFSFTVSEPNTAAVFDIDNGAVAAGEAFNTELFLFDSSDNLLASNNDASTDPGSTDREDARIEYTFEDPGYYTIAVAAFDSSHIGSGRLSGTPPTVDGDYVLNISVSSHTLAKTMYAPTSSETTVFPVAGASHRDGFIFSATEGTSYFEGVRNFDVGDGPYSLVVGDVDGDGIDDVVTANRYSYDVSVLRGKGDGTFQAAQSFPTGDDPRGVVLGDVDGDGIDDIVTANGRSNDASVLLGNGDGTFQPARSFPAGATPREVVLGDVNDDGIHDILIANFSSNDVSVLHGNGDGTFQAAQNLPVGYGPRGVALGDVSGDGIDDIVTANTLGDAVGVLRGNGDGTFQTAQSVSTGDGPYSVVLGDVDGDGIDDIITGNRFSGDVSVLRGNGTFQPAESFATGVDGRKVVLGDVDGDGIDDIVTAGLGVKVLRGNGDGTFQTAQSFAAGFALYGVALADLNGDGINDIVTESRAGDHVSVLRGTGNGIFQTEQTFDAGSRPYAVVLGDVNGDGIDEIVAANRDGDDVSVLRGNGDGTFQTAQRFTAGDRPKAVVLGDVDADGIGDIVAANSGSNDVSVLSGNGDGSFQTEQRFPAGTEPNAVTLGDVSGDGFDDIVTVNSGSDDVSVLLGNGDGTFQTAQSFAAGYGPQAVVLGDVNGDGIDDIVTANSGSDDVSVLLGNGDGTFQIAQSFAAGDGPSAIVLGDVSGDGIDDIVTANAHSDDVSVLLGNGDGTFQMAQSFAVGDTPLAVVLGDVTGDGIDDIVTANRYGREVRVLSGNGDGTFQSRQSFTAGDSPLAVVLSDVSGDGIGDIITVSYFSNDASVLRGRSPIVMSRATDDETIERLPAQGLPFLWTRVLGVAYWLTTTAAPGGYALWSLSPDDGVQKRAVFASNSRPAELEPIGSQISIAAESAIFLFDPSGETLEVIKSPNGTFQTGRSIAAGDRPEAVVVGDVSGDGIDDIVTANRNSDDVSVLRGNGDGTFQSEQRFPTGGSPNDLVLGDVSGDGIDDIVTANLGSRDVSVLQGNGDGTFQSEQRFPTGGRPNALVLGDVNGDGIDDIVTAIYFSNDVSVQGGNGDGTFQTAQRFLGGYRADAVVLGDVNGDGINDIVTAHGVSDQVNVLRGNGDGTFQTAQSFAVRNGPFGVIIGDVSSDGILDIVTANSLSDDVSVLRGNGDGTFQSEESFATGDRPVAVVLGDVNGDGIDDIVTANRYSDNVSVLRGNGDGTFQTAQSFPAGDGPQAVVLGDVSGDGIDDIVTSNWHSDDVSVLRGNGRLERDVVQVADTTVLRTLLVRAAGTAEFQMLPLNDVSSNIGLLRRTRDYEPVRISTFQNQLLALVRLTEATSRPNELQLLLISAPEFHADTGRPLPSDVENLTLNSRLRLTASDDAQLFVADSRIYLTAEIVGSGLGTELLVFDRTNGLRFVAEMLAGPQSSDARDFVSAGDSVYFTALATRAEGSTHRELHVLESEADQVRAVRTGQEVTIPPSAVNGSLFFGSQLKVGDPSQLFEFDDSLHTGVAPAGAVQPLTGSAAGTVFLDRNGDGQQAIDEPGRAGVVLFADLNGNQRLEANEPVAISRSDDPGTPEDEIGQFRFDDLLAGDYQFRELLATGFDQTAPLTISTDSPILTELYSDSAVGLPSVVGDNVVFIDPTTGKLVFQDGQNSQVSLVTLTSLLPDYGEIQSIGSSHAQNGSSIVLTATLVDGREVVLSTDNSGHLKTVAKTATPLTTAAPGQPPGSTTLVDIEDIRNHGFDSLSTAGGNVGFFAETSTGAKRYYLGDGLSFAEFDHAQVILDGNNEVFVDRVIEDTPQVVLGGDDLFLDKATLDAQVGGNTGWQITTRNGEEILPLTFFDRIFDVAISGLSAAFRASSIDGSDAIYLSTEGSTVRLFDTASEIPGGSGTFTGFGSVAGGSEAPSVALDGEHLIFVGRGNGDQIGLYATINGTLRTIADRSSDFGGRTLTGISIGHQAISSNNIVFHATFSDGSESIYRATLPADPVNTVTIPAGDVVTDVLFGASALPGAIRGTSFTDTNADEFFDPGEPANPGRAVFLDENRNGVLDNSETSVVTNANGEFVFSNLDAEQSYVVREILPQGFGATTPVTLEDATVFLPAGGTVELSLGSAPVSVRGESVDGTVEGIVFNDVNSNGVQDTSELGEPGVTVFVDENGDAVRNAGEPSVVTAADGAYVIDELDGRRQVVRIELPEGFEQISPSGNSFTTSELRTVDSPIDVVTGNFDGIAGDDIAATISESNEIQFFFNNGVGEFVPGPAIELPDGAGSIAVGQFGDEGHRDGLVIGHHTSSRVTIVRPAAVAALFVTDELVTPQDVQPGGQYEQLGLAPYFVTTGRFNDDQRDDIAVVSQNNASQDFAAVAIFLNNGDGTFPLEQVLSLPKTDARLASAITAGHVIDGSSTVDIVIANTGTQNVTVLSNTGNSGGGRFEIDGHWPIDGNTPTSVQIGDLNGDGVNEIVTTNLFSDNVSILKNNGSDDFPLPTVLPAGKGPAFGRIVDIDQNGSFDIAFTNNDDDNRFGILRNHGDGTFQAAETSGVVRFPDGTLAFSLDIGQFNDDNDDGIIDERDVPDIAVSNRSNDGINGPAGGLTVGLNAIVAGAQRIDLDPDGRIATGLNFGVRSLNLSSTLIVTSAEATSSGFVFHFSEAIDDGVINLSDDSSPSDLSIVGTATGSVAGSLVFSSDATSATFISTGGPLPPDEYQITLRSDATGWVSAAGNLLDGDRDGNTGDDFTTSIIVAAPAAGTITASLPKFVRGAGQPVALTPSAGIPLTLSNGNGVAGVDVTVRYNPALLQITNFVSEVSGVGAVINVATPGIAILTMSSSAAFADVEGTLVLGHFVAFVPDDAPYSSKHVLDLTDLAIFDTAATPGEFPAVDDDGMHVTSYFGDLNGSGTYNAPDVILQQRLIAQINTGLPDFAAIDPVIIGDITGNGRLQAGDTISIQRVITQIDVANVPDLPAGITPLPANGPDPKVFIPRDLTATAGSTVTVPVQLEVTEPNGITIAGLDLVISYDPRMFTVDNIQLGGLLNNTFIMSANTAINGTIILTTSSATGTSLLPFGTIGDLLTIDFTVKSDATAAASAINLLANSGATFTALTDNNLTDLALIPAPTNSAHDAVDGVLTVIADPPPDVTIVEIVDNGDSGHSSTGFVSYSAGSGHASDYSFAAPGNGSSFSSWTFTVVPGTYRVATTWVAHANRATSAPYTIYDGNNVLRRVVVNQERSPDDFDDSGTNWEEIAVVQITGTTLLVTLSNSADEYVIADAVRIELVSPAVVQIVDDNDDGQSSIGFESYHAGSGHQRGYEFAAAGNGSKTSTWTFEVPPGFYRVSTTWIPHLNRATNAPYAIYDGDSQVGQAILNQELAPDDFRVAGTNWENIAIVHITGTTLQVTLNNSADEFVIADAVRVNLISPAVVQVVDDNDGGQSSAGFVTYDAGFGHQRDYGYAAAGNGSKTSTWTFHVQPGFYRVSTTWIPHLNRATNAPYTIFDGGSQVGQANVNQERAPDDFTDSGINWEDIAIVHITGTTLQVTLNNSADEYVIADAVRIELLSPAVVQIVDDNDRGQSSNGFVSYNAGSGHQRDYEYAAAGNGSKTSTWTFHVPSGFYRVSTTWIPHLNRTTNAPYTIFDGNSQVGQANLNQELAPDDFSIFGTSWEDIAIVHITGTTLQVTLNNSADEYVIADAVRIELLSPAVVQIVDDNDRGQSSNGFVSYQTGSGHLRDYEFAAAGNGDKSSTWTFHVSPGFYRVSATWIPHLNRATNAPYRIFDGDNQVGQANLNQERVPDDFSVLGTNWEDIAIVHITGTTLQVTLNNSADEYVIADAVRIELVSPAVVQIVDDNDRGQSSTGFVSYNTGSGHLRDYEFAAAGSGSVTSTWTFDVLPGLYRVSTTWVPHLNRATNAPYAIYDGDSQVGQKNLNQELAPDDFSVFGTDWEYIAIVPITGTLLHVTLNNSADEYVIADAVRIELLSSADIQIIDDNGGGQASTGFQSHNTDSGHLQGYKNAAAGDGSKTSTWTDTSATHISVNTNATTTVETELRFLDVIMAEPSRRRTLSLDE